MSRKCSEQRGNTQRHLMWHYPVVNSSIHPSIHSSIHPFIGSSVHPSIHRCTCTHTYNMGTHIRTCIHAFASIHRPIRPSRKETALSLHFARTPSGAETELRCIFMHCSWRTMLRCCINPSGIQDHGPALCHVPCIIGGFAGMTPMFPPKL